MTEITVIHSTKVDLFSHRYAWVYMRFNKGAYTYMYKLHANLVKHAKGAFCIHNAKKFAITFANKNKFIECF